MDTYCAKGRKSVFLKIVVTFMLVIMPLYFFSVYLNLLSRESIRREIRDSTRSKVDFYLDGIEKEFNGIMLMQQSLMGDSELIGVSTDDIFMQQYERNRAILSIQNRLTGIKNLSRYIEDITILVPLIGKRISTVAIAEALPSDIEELEAVVAAGNYPFHMAEDRIYIHLASPNRVMVDNRLQCAFIITVEISRPFIEQTLAQITTYEGGGALMAGDDSGINASSTGEEVFAGRFDVFLSSAAKTGEAQAATLRIDSASYIVVHETSRLLDTTLLAYIPEEELFGSLSLYWVWIFVITLITSVVIVVFALYVRRVISRPLQRLIGAFGRLDEGDTDISVSYESGDEFGDLYGRFNEMVGKFGNLIRQVYEERLHAKDAELKQLQYQINPHFLYNTIYILYRMAKAADLDAITRLTLHLGDYYKFISGNFGDTVPLEREWEHAGDYIGIQSFRFSRRIDARLEPLPEDCRGIPVPRLILQPIIENAYKHGLKDMETDGVIHISFAGKAGKLSAFVEDNGNAADDGLIGRMREIITGKRAGGAGMRNIHRRLEIMYGGDSGLYLSRSCLGGLCIEIRIAPEEEKTRVQLTDRG